LLLRYEQILKDQKADEGRDPVPDVELRLLVHALIDQLCSPSSMLV
jgi:hypothetical protein